MDILQIQQYPSANLLLNDVSSSQSSGAKRQRVDSSHDNVAEHVMDTSESTASAAATETPSTTSPTIIRDLIMKAIKALIEEHIHAYEKARRDLRRRELSLSVLKSHSDKGTVPQDLRLTVGTGNPYAMYVVERNQLLEEEQHIWENAKRTILAARIRTMEKYVKEQQLAVARMETLDSFFDTLRLRFQDKIRPSGDVLHESQEAFELLIVTSKSKMDALFAKADAKFLAKQQKKAKSTPTTTNAVDQATFTKALRSEVEDILHNIIKSSEKSSSKVMDTDKSKKASSASTNAKKQQQSKPQRSYADVVSGSKEASVSPRSTQSKSVKRSLSNNSIGGVPRGQSTPTVVAKASTAGVPGQLSTPSIEGLTRETMEDMFKQFIETYHTTLSNKQNNNGVNNGNNDKKKQGRRVTFNNDTSKRSSKNESAQDQRTRPRSRESNQQR